MAYNADGVVASVLDAMGFVNTTTFFTNSDLVQALIDPLGRRTAMVYDQLQRRTGTQNPLGRWVTAVYDPLSRAHVYENELGYLATVAFDADGRLDLKWDALNRKITYVYDAASQKTGTQYTDGTRITMSYDPLGRPTTMVDWGGTTTYAFDSRSSLTGKTEPGGSSQAYYHDSVRNRTLLIDPDGGLHTYTFDALNRQATYARPSGGLFTAQYDAGSGCTTVTDEFGGQLVRAYDSLGRVATLIEYAAAGNPVATVVDSYDGGGRKTSQLRDSLLITYANDAAGRLIGEQAVGRWATFIYDGADSVSQKWYQGNPPMTQTFDAANRILSMLWGSALTNYTYNAVGNMTVENETGATTGYVYDGENRLTRLTNPDGTVITNTYSGDGLRRTSQQPGANVSTMIWDASNYLGQI